MEILKLNVSDSKPLLKYVNHIRGLDKYGVIFANYINEMN